MCKLILQRSIPKVCRTRFLLRRRGWLQRLQRRGALRAEPISVEIEVLLRMCCYLFCFIGLCVAAGLSGGCATIRTTDPPRTATEMFLMSEAATRAVDQLKNDSLRDRKVYLD